MPIRNLVPWFRLSLCLSVWCATPRSHAMPVLGSPTASRTLFYSGQPLSLGIDASGDGPLTYRWKKDNRLLPGVTGATLARTSASRADAGVYVTEITDAHGETVTVFNHVLMEVPSPGVGGWGQTFYGQLAPPPSVAGVVAISAGGFGSSSLALKNDGTIVSMGNTLYDPVNLPDALTDPATANVAAISEGYQHTLALRADGTVVGWGNFNSVPASLARVIAISAGYDHSLALKSDGTVAAWGASYYGQTNIPSGLTEVVAVSAGHHHSLALRRDGTVVAWGDNSSQQCAVPSDLGNVVAIAAGASFSLALKADGTVAAWGGSRYRSVPDGLADVIAIAAGGVALALRADGTVAAWGGYNNDLNTPALGATRVTAIAAGTTHALVLRDTSLDTIPTIINAPATQTLLAGAAITFTTELPASSGLCTYQWRKNEIPLNRATSPSLALYNLQSDASGTYSVSVTNSRGSTIGAIATITVIPPPTLVSTPPARQLLNPGQSLQLAVSATDSSPLTYRWKHNGRVVADAVGPVLTRDPATVSDAGYYVVEVTNTRGLVSRAIAHVLHPVAGPVRIGWGSLPYDLRGSGIAFPMAGELVDIAACGENAMGLKSDGTVISWGPYGRLTATSVVAIASGYNHSLALKSDGTVIASGPSGSPATAVPSSVTGIVAIAAGHDHSLAIKADGTVLQWGRDSGSLPFFGLTGVVAIAAGGSHSLVLQANGSVIASGGYRPPSTLRNVIAIAAGDNHSVALEADGTVVAWGDNTKGQATPPAGLRHVVAIRASGNHTLALTADGTVVAWGQNTSGQVTVPALLQNVRLLAAGGAFSLVVRDSSHDGFPVLTVPASPVYVTAGKATRIGVEATGGALEFTWEKDGAPYPAATGPSVNLAPAQSTDSGVYRVTATNSSGSVTGDPITVEVVAPPSVTLSVPVRHVLTPGQPLNIAATPTGHGALTCRWFKNGRLLSAAKGLSYFVPSATTFDGGRYEVEILDSHGGGIARATAWVFVVPIRQQVVVWGSHPSTIPPNLGRVIAIDGGSGYTVALRDDGTVTAWGPSLGVNPLPPPAAVRDVVAISAGQGHILALRADGRVVSWVGNSHQIYLPSDLNLTDAVAISAGYGYRSAAVRRDGSVVAWDMLSSTAESVPAGLKNVTAITSAFVQPVMLRADGTIVSVGGTAYASWSDVTAVAAGLSFTLGLRSDGSVLWSSPPVPADTLGTVAEIFAHRYHALGRAADGTVRAWAKPGDPNAFPPPGLSSVALLAAGHTHSIALRDASGDATPTLTGTPPAATTTVPGQTITFTAAASDAIYYRWYRNGVELAGNSGPVMSFLADAANEEGTYEVRAISGAGEAVSAPFTLRFPERFETWRLRGFSTGELTDTTISGPLAVNGPDHSPNLLKYALGVGPREAVSSTTGTLFHDADGSAFVYTRPEDRPDITYEVQTSTDLLQWSSLDVEHTRIGEPADGMETWIGRIPGDEPRRFFRLNVIATP